MLSAEQQQRFFEVGWVVCPGVFVRREVDRMRAAFDRLAATARRLGSTRTYRGSLFVLDGGGDEAVRIRRIVWCGAAEPVLAELGRDPRLLECAAQLLGSREMSQLINQAHFKLPGDGVAFPWHQDSTHRRYGTAEWVDINGRGSYVQMVVAVDDVTPDNGPIEFLPGSCRLGHVQPAAGCEGELPVGLDERLATPATMAAGSVAMFGPYTFHRSRPNRSKQARRVLINGFAYPGANSRVYPGDGAGRTLRLHTGPALPG